MLIIFVKKPAELLNQAWSKAKYKYRAKNVLALVNRSTCLARWVASVITWQSTLRGRVRAFTKMIQIAEVNKSHSSLDSPSHPPHPTYLHFPFY